MRPHRRGRHSRGRIASDPLDGGLSGLFAAWPSVAEDGPDFAGKGGPARQGRSEPGDPSRRDGLSRARCRSAAKRLDRIEHFVGRIKMLT